jgi:hypothetical protein
MGDLGCSFVAERVEEPVQAGAVAAHGRPDEASGVVVDDDGEVALPALV